MLMNVHDLSDYLIVVFGLLVVGCAIYAQSVSGNPSVAKQLICTECFTVGNKVKKVKGSWLATFLFFFIGMVSWLFISIWFGASLCVIGVIYKIWRIASVRYVCPCCEKDAMIPIDTPRGKKLLIETDN